MNSYQLLQNEDCDIEIHNTQQENKWLKKKIILEQKKETTDEIEYKNNQKMKWVMYKKEIYILKIYLYGWKKRCEIIKMKIVRNRVICVDHFTMWKNMVQQTCSICIGPIQDKYVTSCNHEFCKSCISKWLCTKQNCPMCREKIEPIESVIEKGSRLDELANTPERIYREDLWQMLISSHNLFRSLWGETIFRNLYNHMGYTSADFEMSDFSRDSFWYDVNLRLNMLLGSGTISVGMSPNTRDCFTNLYNIVLEYRRLIARRINIINNAVSTE